MSIIRDITLESQNDLQNDKILLFIGPRQAGKTTILRQIQAQLESAQYPCIFLNLEDPDYLRLLNESPKNLFKIFTLSSSQKIFVLIDEIQYLDDPTNFLKYFYDEYKDKIKLIVSGSSAFYIDRKFKDSLVGRKKIFTVNTLSFREFLRFKEKVFLLKFVPTVFAPKNSRLKDEISLKDYEILRQSLDEFVIFGGYPRVVLTDDAKEKENVLQDIAYSYIKKDLYDNNVREEEVFFKLMKILASQAGCLVNANELANTLHVSKTAIDHYLYILQKSYHIALVRPFSGNVRKELTKMPKVFFRDTGLRNFFTGKFGAIALRDDKGALLENSVFRQWMERFDSNKINFWRTQQGHEVDFVIDSQYAFEVKYDPQSIVLKKYHTWSENYPNILLQFIVYEAKDKIKADHSPFWELWEI